MNQKEKIELTGDISRAYKAAIQPLYIKWNKLGNQYVSEMFTYWVYKHNHDKAMDRINKRKHRKSNLQKIKQELDTLKKKEEIDNFLKI